jgi:hypothetical protein
LCEWPSDGARTLILRLGMVGSKPVLPACATLLLGTALPFADSTFASVLDDLALRVEVGTGIYGDDLTGALGAQSLGIFDLKRRWILTWSGDVDLVLGGVAYEHPFYWLYGAQGEVHGEGGWRALPGRAWSPYLSVGLDGALSAITQPGVPFDKGATINNLDGLGGVIGMGDARLGLGASLLDRSQSLVVEVQPVAEVDSAESNQPLLSYFGGALHARYDRPDSLTAIGELAYLATPTQTDAALGSSSVSGRWTLSASALRRFGRGLGLSVSRSATQLAYIAGQTYTTDSPVDSRFWLLFGYWP